MCSMFDASYQAEIWLTDWPSVHIINIDANDGDDCCNIGLIVKGSLL